MFLSARGVSAVATDTQAGGKPKGPGRKRNYDKEPVPIPATLTKDQSWWPAMRRFMDQARLVKGDSLRGMGLATRIPQTTCAELVEGVGRMPLEYFIRIAEYGAVSPPTLLAAILEEGKDQSVRAMFRALPLSDQLALAHEALDRAEAVLRGDSIEDQLIENQGMEDQ